MVGGLLAGKEADTNLHQIFVLRLNSVTGFWRQVAGFSLDVKRISVRFTHPKNSAIQMQLTLAELGAVGGCLCSLRTKNVRCCLSRQLGI